MNEEQKQLLAVASTIFAGMLNQPYAEKSKLAITNMAQVAVNAAQRLINEVCNHE